MSGTAAHLPISRKQRGACTEEANLCLSDVVENIHF